MEKQAYMAHQMEHEETQDLRDQGKVEDLLECPVEKGVGQEEMVPHLEV